MTEFDVINKAQHYNSHPSGVEAIEICRYLTGDWFNAFKYVDPDRKLFFVAIYRGNGAAASWVLRNILERDV